MTTIDLAPYSSYFSIATLSDSNSLSTGASGEQANVFSASNYSSFSVNTVSSPDIEFDSTTGRITARVTGTYLLVFIPSVTLSSGLGVGVTARINRNGSNVVTVENLTAFTTTDPISATCHRVLDLTAGDYIGLTVSATSTDAIVAQNGTSFTMLKANGDYASLAQSGDGSAGTANTLEVIGNTVLAGNNNITTNLNNITYNSNTGKLTPANTRPFFLLATLVGASDTKTEETTIGVYANNTLIDEASALIHEDDDPNEESYGLLKTLTGGQTVSARYQGGTGTTITTKKGTSFSVLDLSNSDGAGTPSAFISFSVAADSDPQNIGEKNCFDEDLWTSYSTTVHSAATNISYASDTGFFTVQNAGKYLVLWNVVLGNSITSTDRNAIIKKDGNEVYSVPLMVHTSFDPIERTICVILEAEANETFTFKLQGVRGKIAEGTGVTIVKIDDLEHLDNSFFYDRPNTNLFDDHGAPAALIADDFTINSFSADGLSSQHNRLKTKQVPFSLGIRGPMSLRGKPASTDETPQNVSTGIKKT